MKISERLVLRKRSASKGFTLVELLIVIAVIGILATVLIVAVNPGRQLQKSRDTQRKADLKSLQTSLEQFYQDVGSYPTDSLCRSDQTSNCWGLSGTSIFDPPSPNNASATNYIKVMPIDPSQTGTNCTSTTNSGYAYQALSGGTGYYLSTRLENASDSQVVSPPSGASCTAHNYFLTNQQ